MKVASIMVGFALIAWWLPTAAFVFAGALMGFGFGIYPDDYTTRKKIDAAYGTVITGLILLVMVLVARSYHQ